MLGGFQTINLCLRRGHCWTITESGDARSKDSKSLPGDRTGPGRVFLSDPFALWTCLRGVVPWGRHRGKTGQTRRTEHAFRLHAITVYMSRPKIKISPYLPKLRFVGTSVAYSKFLEPFRDPKNQGWKNLSSRVKVCFTVPWAVAFSNFSVLWRFQAW
jgi:hypothetical protein